MIALDSSVMVTGVVRTDERHAKALRAIRGAFDSPEGMLVPVHALVETYAVITRMPAPHRATPAEAVKALRDTFGVARLAPLSARSVWILLDDLAGASFGGGLTYDAIILKSAEDAGATVLLTWNIRDYERLSPRIEIRTP
jgi:predicted nucleic acid-binding protein